MKVEIAERWVDALLSGDYEQGKSALCKDGKYCCLGVLCDMYAKEHDITWVTEGNGGSMLLGANVNLPFVVMEWAGIKDNCGEVGSGLYLTELNDDGTPFKAIARIIEANVEVL